MTGRGDISIADALAAAAILGTTEPSELAALDLAVPGAPTLDARVAEVMLAELPPGPVPTPPQGPLADQVTTPGLPVAARLREDPRVQVAPAWLAVTPVLSGARPGGATVPAEPLLPAGRARSSMILLTATPDRGRRLDVPALLRQVALLKPLSAMYEDELRTAAFVQLLVDVGEAMQPFTEDLAFLADQLIDVAGQDRVEERTFTGTPRRGLDPDPFGGSGRPWKPPPPGSLVVVLSDLGVGGPVGDRDRAPAREWLMVARAIAEAQANVRVLTPFPLHRVPTPLARKLRITPWDDLAHLVRLRG
jgi:hypothetical protein